MSLHRRLLAASLTLALSACADMGHIAPQSAMLDANALQASQAMDAAASAAIQWPRAQWWQDLHDPQLNRLMDQALAEIARVLRPGGLAWISEPVFAGDMNEVIRLFHDEQQVREAAFAAIGRAVHGGRLQLVEQLFFHTRSHWYIGIVGTNK